MIIKPLLQSLYQYTFWADEQLFERAQNLSDALLRQEHAYSRGSVWEQMRHMVAVEFWWFYFLRTDEMPSDEQWQMGETLTELQARWTQNKTDALAYTESASEDELTRMVKPPHWDADEKPVAAWQAMVQVANHSTDHRSQILRLLYDLGAPTFEQDYLNYLGSLSG